MEKVAGVPKLAYIMCFVLVIAIVGTAILLGATGWRSLSDFVKIPNIFILIGVVFGCAYSGVRLGIWAARNTKAGG